MKKTLILFSIAAMLSIAIFSTTSCKKSSNSSPATSSLTLYDSLGGTTKVIDPTNSADSIESGYLAIRSVVDSAIFVIAGDNVINGFFSTLLAEVSATPANVSGLDALSANLTNFIAVGTGAKDFVYGGKSMPDAHNPALNSRINGVVTNAAMTQFENDVVTGATQNKVPTYLIDRLGSILESLRSQVVNQ